MSELIKFDVAQQTAGHREDKRSIKQNQACLSNVCVIEENQAGCENASRKSVARFPHYVEDHWDSQSSQKSRHGTKCNIRDLVVDVRVANIFEVEMSIIAHEPTHQREK